MELIFLNNSHEIVGWVDSYTELLWIERYDEPGEFELITSPTPEILYIVYGSAYVAISGVPRSLDIKMRIESISIKPGDTGIHTETGDKLFVAGRSLESMLDQRIVWDNTLLCDFLEPAIFQLITDNALSPSDPDRVLLSNFRLDSNGDPTLEEYYVFVHLQGEYILDTIVNLCRNNGVGFSMIWDPEESEYVFRLEVGKDRSYSQQINSRIAFTTELENLLNPVYEESTVPEKNVCLVVLDESDGSQTTVTAGEGTGLNRKEIFLRANPQGEQSEFDKMYAMLGCGIIELSKHPYFINFNGEADTTMYTYGVDYNLGDIAYIADAYGHAKQIRLVEMIFSQNSAGIRMYPCFKDIVPRLEQSPNFGS